MCNSCSCGSVEEQLSFPFMQEVLEKDPVDITDPNDKQWLIECQLLEIDKLKAKTDNLKAKLALLGAQDTTPEMRIESTCAYCGSTFKCTGIDVKAVNAAFERFCDVHNPCGVIG